MFVRRLVVLVVVAGLPAAAMIAPSPGSAASDIGGIGVRVADVPAGASDPLARSYILGTVKPGTTVRRKVELTNTTNTAVTIAFYPAAAHLQGGRFTFSRGRQQNDLTRWTSVSRATLRLEPGTRALETVTIDVPADAASGERYAVAWAAVSSPSGGGSVMLVNRVGVRMYMSVGGSARAGSFAISGLAARRAANGQPLVIATIANNGSRTLDLSGSLTLSAGPAGLAAGPFRIAVRPPLTPGITTQIQLPLEGLLPRGPWRVRIHLAGDSIHRTSAATLTFPPQARPPIAARDEPPFRRIPMAVQLGGVGLVILTLALSTLWLSRRWSYLPR